MKFNSNVFSLAILAALPSITNAAPTVMCDEQAPCIEFTMNKLNSDSCGIGGPCTIEVCFHVDAGQCIKGSGSSFSHMCSGTDQSGCPQWANDDGVTPRMGYGSGSTCSQSGQGSGAAAFGGKCSGSDVLMCQEGKPGDTLYWILKDGNDKSKTVEDTTFSKVVNGCTDTVRCFNSVYACGGTEAQKLKERTWSYTIPDGTGSCPNACGSGPTPNPPAPEPPAPVPEPPAPVPDPPAPPPTTPAQPLSPVSPPTPNPPTPTSDNITPTPGSNGDPHFKTWNNEHFEYHGQCDLVLTKDPNFADGLGLDIQLRTKLVRFWSYIRNAAVRIGHDIIELEGSSDSHDESVRYWYNMQFKSDEAKTLGGFPMAIRRSDAKKTRVEIDLDSKYPGVKIVMSTYKEFVKVEVEGAAEESFGNSVGLLGDFKTGKTLARDGKTNIQDFIEYGNEWQVTPMEDMIFHSTEEPQFPKKCLEPEDPRGERRRRLAESNVTMEQAEKACAGLKDPLDRKDCVYDIVATQDIGMAGAF